MNLPDHPIWTQTTPYKSRISSFKKPFHILRIKIAKQFARIFKRELFIGVTGSVGKTTCVQAIDAVLSEKIKVISTKPNLDPILNIPITILNIRPNTKKVILEMGIEFKGEMEFYISIVRPKTVVVTRLYFAHSEYLGSVDDIIGEKGKLIEQLPEDGVAILNFDDINCRKLAQRTKAEIIYFGKDKKNCSIWADKIRIENFNTVFELNYGVERVEIKYQLIGEHQVYSALAAAAIGVIEGLSLIQIKKGLEKVIPAEHRLQFVEGFNGATILDDTYNNASPIGAEAAIDTLMSIPSKRRILVMGEMRELGSYSEELHRQIARKIYDEKPDYVFLGTGDATIVADELIRLGFWEEKLESNLQNPQIVSKLLKLLSKGDICLIKASRSLRMDEVVKRIAKKQK
ncbi:hypothetical protein A3F00_03135 [Candidatus Daviesbacteria bacterium RIFCSPHIGHO2_12_FULL_37_11]|uniref:UDP-N-acetylmuramoyl-tripeptide--D-alanyl-D-alanine ligase n=1 Tax=Candidatus Daviesbacteria bacterium RIFCSPHIGHO2_12_FULL_37_11 TaxID=1797777 RepID=A0A1F5KBH5_9BACT|nr:MAG: hypothetical protein A2769_04425 [Candidatus Daviesbacteria bacterium RIFCSPHIGHO2_01_FULL_37_27]OGE38292.1 MAG: hypothetical protein A3F00_03135 [Candidatus Daviesbacteria bacterium RIFCSPHIGHO2_12_FULL_37_11]OGE46248.1 MAG: hypothetical protein A3B39_02900 [Candidatus Daviesbacteria bacterium RIFCSPLOWO2_01_FULL_37_10]